MSTKAIIVVNLPGGENPDDYEFRYALLTHKQGKCPIGKIALEVRGGNIKPMPKPKKHDDEYDYDYGFIDGWNDCIEEIEKC